MTRGSIHTRVFGLLALGIPIAGILALVILWIAGTPLRDLFATRNQQGARAIAHQDYEEAARRFSDPIWRGIALFRTGEFEQASIAFAARDDAISLFDRGNALVMFGKYEQAMAAYDRALNHRPGWARALENREIARLRLEKLARPDDDSGGTGGKLAPDQIVVDDNPKGKSKPEEVEVGQGAPLSDAENQALWLRRVKTSPGDFLRSKFAHQYRARQEKKDD